MIFADAHIHLADMGVFSGYPDLEEAGLLFSCSAQSKDWDLQNMNLDPRTVPFYGIHPWYAEQWNQSTKNRLRRILSEDTGAQVGEIGLDNRHAGMEKQVLAFTEQILIASEMKRTVNIHNIGCDGDIVKILKRYGKNCRGIILHSFRNPNTDAFAGLNCWFGINPRILEKSEEHVSDIISHIPRDRILLETDAPFTSKNFTSMEDFIGRLAGITGTEPEELACRTLENARRALQ